MYSTRARNYYRIKGFVCVSQILRICPKTLLFFICVFLCLRFLVLSVVYYITLSIGVNFMRIQLFAIQKYSQIKRKLDYREKKPLYGIYHCRPSVSFTLSSQLLLYPLGDFDETLIGTKKDHNMVMCILLEKCYSP